MTAASRLAVPSLIIAAAFSLHAAPQLGGMAYSNAFPDAASIANFHKYYTAGDPVYGGLEWGIYATGGPTSDDGYVVPYVQTNQNEWDAGRAINEFGVFYDQSPAAVLTDALVYCSVQCRAWVGHFVGAAARMNADNSLYAAVFGTPDGSAWRLRIIKRAANGSVSILADQSLGALIAWRNYRVEFQCFGNELIARLVDLYNGSQAGEVTATDSTITGPGACGIVAQAVLDGPPWTDHKSPVWDVVAFEMLPPPPDTNIYLHIDVRKAGTGEAIPAVLQLRYNNSGGAFLPQSTAGWTDPQGVFTFGPTWHQKVGASPATVWIQAYQGDEFEYTNLTVSVPASGTNITIYLTPRVDMSALGWWAGGDHNHLGRGGKKPWKHNGGTLSMEYMATVLSALGYDWWACGVNGGWEIENAGDPLSDNATVRTVMYYADAGLRQACNNFNSNYPAALNLWYGNEHAKTRYGHLWSVGKSTAANGDYPHPNTYPAKSGYGDGFIHNWWALYDGNMDLWMYGLGSQAQDWYWPQYSDTAALELPPYHEIVWALNNANVYSIWAHLTATYPPMYTKLLPFDLLAGVKIGGVAMIGADEATSFNMCLDGYNRGYQFAGFGENDTAYDNATFPRNYTFIYCPVVTKQSFDLNTVLEWGCRSNKTISSSGALAILDADDGAITIGDNVAADGASHTLRIRAWANTRPGDVLASVSLYRNGAVFRSWSPNTTSFETNVVVSETERAYYLLRVNDNVAARKCITSPIYFVPDTLKPVPPPLRGTVAGGVYDYRGNAIPGVTVDLLYTGALYATTVGDAAGKYRFTNAPADCVLHFHNGAGLDERRSPILHDEAMNDYLLRTITGQYYYAGGGLGGVLDPNVYTVFSNMMMNCTVNLRSKNHVPLALFDDTGWDGWTFSSAFTPSLESAKARQGNCVKLVKQNANGWNSLMYARDVTALADWSNAVGMVVALNGASGLPGGNRIWIEFRWRVITGATTNEFYRNTQYIPTGDHWYDSYLPLRSNLFHGDRIEMWANFLINPGSGGSGAVIYMDELRVIVPKKADLTPVLITPADGAYIATDLPLMAWSCDEPSVSNFTVVIDGTPVDAGLAQQYQVPSSLSESAHTWYVIAANGSAAATSTVGAFTVDITPPDPGAAAFIEPAGGESWLEGSTYDPEWTTTGISDVNLDPAHCSLWYYQDPGYGEIISAFDGLEGTYAWYIAGIPHTFSNTHLKLVIPDKAGNTASITSPAFNLIDQGDVRTAGWRYVTVYPFNDGSLDGMQNGSKATLSWDTNSPYAGAGCLRASFINSSAWAHVFYKPDISPDANWTDATSMRLRARFPATMGFGALTRLDMIFFFGTNGFEYRQIATLDNAWHEYVFPLNSNDFHSAPVTMDLILQAFGDQVKVGDWLQMDEIEIYTWDDIPEPGAAACVLLACAAWRRARGTAGRH